MTTKQLISNVEISIETFLPHLHEVVTNNTSVGYVVSLFHLIDQHRWGIISQKNLITVGFSLLNSLRKQYALEELNAEKETKNYKQILEQVNKSIIQIINKSLI